MRRIVAFVALVASVVGSGGAPASAALPPTYLCDVDGPIYIDQGSYEWRWTLVLSGSCVDRHGVSHALALTFHATLPSDYPLCPDPGGLPTAAIGGSGYGTFNGVGLTWATMRWDWGSPPGSTVSPFEVWASNLAVSYAGGGIQANKAVLECPVTYPHTSHGRFVFTWRG